MSIINAGLRGFQFFCALIVMALIGDIISDSTNGSPSVVNYVMFCAVFAMLALFYLIPASIKDSLTIHPLLPTILDGLIVIFWFCGAVALAARLGAHSCSNEEYLMNNSVTNGAPNMSHRCREAQASTAFLWFGWVAFVGSLFFSFMASRGSGASTGIRRGPAMSQV